MYFIYLFIIFIFLRFVYLFYRKKGFLLYSRYGLPNIFLFIAFLISFFSFLNFNINSLQNLKKSSSNVVFILDVSKSMLAIDYKEKSRLEISKEFIRNFILNNLQNKYSLTIFSWDAISVIPLTNDKNLFLTLLESVDEKSILKWWTNLLSSLKVSLERFFDNENWWAIVLISDFETNKNSKEKNILSSQISKINTELNKKNIKLYLVWVWKKSWNKIIVWYDIFGRNIYLKDNFWKDVITKFDKDFFAKLPWEKHIIDDIEDIKKISLKNIPSFEIDSEENIKIDFSRYFMFFSFLCFLVYLFLFYYFDKKWK